MLLLLMGVNSIPSATRTSLDPSKLNCAIRRPALSVWPISEKGASFKVVLVTSRPDAREPAVRILMRIRQQSREWMVRVKLVKRTSALYTFEDTQAKRTS